MTDRIKMMKDALKVDKYTFCFERAKIMTKVFEDYAGYPMIVKRAIAIREYLDHKTVFIEHGELVVGNIASKPMGMEVINDRPQWTDEELDELVADGLVEVSEEDRAFLREMNKGLLNKGYGMNAWMGRYYNDERLWPFMQRGFQCPAWKSRNMGIGNGYAGCGWGFDIGTETLWVNDYAKWINEGVGIVVERAKKGLVDLRFRTRDDIDRADFYTACIEIFPALIRLAHRYADEAERLAKAESDPARVNELLEIAETCRWVPEHPARTFREAVQSFFFFWVMTATGTCAGGRFDQYTYPYYKADLEAGHITRAEALETLEALRIKIMQYGFVFGGAKQRSKWAGMARWHNFVLGGCDQDGKPANNDITYLMLEAAKDTQTPHPTVTLRISKDTPDDLMRLALEVVKTGIGMPAFVSEDSYIKFFTNEGCDIREARNFAIAGCLDAHLPGRSRNLAFCMFITPLVLETAIHNGHDPHNGVLVGVEPTVKFEDSTSFEEFYEKNYLEQLRYLTARMTEYHLIKFEYQRRWCPDAVVSAFMEGAWETGLDCLSRPMLFEQNGEGINVVGMESLCDSMAALKKIVFEDKIVTPTVMKAALTANWEGFEELQKLCDRFPKYGNNDDYTDAVATKVWTDMCDIIHENTTNYGHAMVASAISITAHAPGGASCTATPDGRFDGETFADGSTSPRQGYDEKGPLAVFLSAMKLPQDRYMATLMNMKFSPASLKTDSDLKKLGDAVKVYLTGGGKHVQFNVIDSDTLREAKTAKAKYRDLIVRVAGYSAYYTQLTDAIQNELIARTEQSI
ncbi:MAG: hypothetical protein LIO57_09190 [Oscillospiraceae bacterium]|nr:hypothetical protein [Oscillospiraceae bacterium]